MASPTTETNKIANANTTKLIKAADDITKVIEALKHTTEIHGDLSQAIAEKELALSQLEVRFQEEQRRRQVEMDLDFREREATKVTEVLARQGKIAVESVAYQTLLSAHNALKADFAKQLEEEVGKIKQTEAAKTAAAIKHAQLELQVKEAANTASITSLTERNALLAQQVTDYKSQLDAEREARIAEAKARGNPMVTVNSTK